MKVNIGPYRSWIGPYQIADWLQHVGVSEDKRHDIGEWLSNTWVNTFCSYIHQHKKRRENVRIDKYDVWSMDATLAMIIVPMLKQLQIQKHGSPFVDNLDVPEGMRSTDDPDYNVEHMWDTDKFVHDRWEYVMNEMIWAFEQCLADTDNMEKFYVNGKLDREGYKKVEDRITNGLRLFGKYYRGLWD